jgi:hypothetical protein
MSCVHDGAAQGYRFLRGAQQRRAIAGLEGIHATAEMANLLQFADSPQFRRQADRLP